MRNAIEQVSYYHGAPNRRGDRKTLQLAREILIKYCTFYLRHSELEPHSIGALALQHFM